jgi:ABC-type sugar transport system ATPase subunit
MLKKRLSEVEAMTLANKLVVLNHGTVEQVGTVKLRLGYSRT